MPLPSIVNPWTEIIIDFCCLTDIRPSAIVGGEEDKMTIEEVVVYAFLGAVGGLLGSFLMGLLINRKMNR
jgi:H+/Cl- antiporter ClcA